MNATAKFAEKIDRNRDFAVSNLVFSRNDLARRVANCEGYEPLANAVNAVAEAEGKLEVWDYLKAYSNFAIGDGKEFTEVDAIQVMMKLLTKGADDTWSGRGNDAKRAFFDGIRDAARDLRGDFS